MKSDKIWCFWEPHQNIHEYLKLCLKTWEKLGRDIIILDDSNLDDYLSDKEVKLLKKTKKYYSLPQYADAVRVMILHKYGGIWMDLDTIIVHPEYFDRIEGLKADTELLAIDYHIGWLWASKDSKIIKLWYKALIAKLDFPKWQINRDGSLRKYWRVVKFAKFSLAGEAEKTSRLLEYITSEHIDWDYLGNSIVDPLFSNAKPNEYSSLTKLLPYETFLPESGLWKAGVETTNKQAIYRDYWFTPVSKAPQLEHSIMVCLHNSWTPPEYQRMDKEEFLKSSTRMAFLFKRLLNEA